MYNGWQFSLYFSFHSINLVHTELTVLGVAVIQFEPLFLNLTSTVFVSTEAGAQKMWTKYTTCSSTYSLTHLPPNVLEVFGAGNTKEIFTIVNLHILSSDTNVVGKQQSFLFNENV